MIPYKHKIVKGMTMAGLCLLLFSCNNDGDQQEEKTDNRISVIAAIAEEKTYTRQLTFSGTVFPMREANLGSSMPGKIEQFYYPKGTYVNEGDTLVKLSSEMLTQAKIEYQALQKDFARIKRLYEKSSVSEMEYDHLKAKLDAARVKTEMLRKNTCVVAPFSGIIADYLLEEGENFFFTLAMEPGYSNTSGILRLMQLNPVKAEIEVNEKDLTHLNEGQTVNIVADAFPDKSYTGTIHFIEPMLSTMSRSATVEISVPNRGHQLKPGMYVRCIVDATQTSGVFVPIDAITRQQGAPYEHTYVVRGDSVIKQYINRLDTEGTIVRVDSVSAGDTIVTKGKNKLSNGSKITINRVCL
ncbi:MAG: efflux RND transporter periplasmic adaptor subunit [Bacteroidota bacterium]|nr:efflux RND transporter periplasmic adaptor subunit [Bacteroidota bacterium]